MAIHFTQVAPIGCDRSRSRFGAADHPGVGGRRGRDCLLHEAIKQLAATLAGATIEAQSEFIQVVRQVLGVPPLLGVCRATNI